LNDINSMPNFMKIYGAVQTLLSEAHRQTDKQTHTHTGDLISLLRFIESRLKISFSFLLIYLTILMLNLMKIRSST
jgi:hypothetical protein